MAANRHPHGWRTGHLAAMHAGKTQRYCGQVPQRTRNQVRRAEEMKRRTTPRAKALWVRIAEDGTKAGLRTNSPRTSFLLTPSGQTKAPGARRWKQPRPVSDRQRHRLSIYRRLRRSFLQSNQKCARYSTMPSREIHHTRGRAGTLLVDVRFWVAVSREAHDWIQSHPIEARAEGLLCPVGSWNTPPNDAETDRLRWLLKP